MPAHRKPLNELAPSAFAKNRKRNEAAGRPLSEPDFAVLDLATPPETLSTEAADIWLALAPHIVHVVKVTDALLLAQLCECYAELREDLDTVRRSGRVVINPMTGVEAKHPLLSEIADKRKTIITLSGHFGLSPSTRRLIGPVDEKPETDDFKDV